MAAPSDIFLKWNSHHDVMVSLLYSQLEKKNFVDVTIGAEGKFINAHRLILCTASEYFEDLLGQQHQPAAAVVILQNVKFCDAQAIVEYIYKGEVSLSGDQLDSFLEAAKSLKIKGLTQRVNNLNQVQELPNQVPIRELTQKVNNPNQVQEQTVAVEMPLATELTPDSIRPAEEVSESAEQPENIIMMETEGNSNHQEPIQQVEEDVVIVDPGPRPPPVVINLEETMVEDEQVPQQSAMVNQDSDSTRNESVDEDSSSDDEEMDPRQCNSTQPDGNRQASAGFYNCGACGRAYKTMLSLKRHKFKLNCQTVPYFRCTLCVVCNDSRGGMKCHISRAHKNLLPSQFDDYIVKIEPTLVGCKVCSYRCKDPVSLQRHNKKEHEGFRGF